MTAKGRREPVSVAAWATTDIVSDFEAESSTKKPKFSTSAVADTAAAGPSSNQVLTGLVPTPDEETGREVEAGGVARPSGEEIC